LQYLHSPLILGRQPPSTTSHSGVGPSAVERLSIKLGEDRHLGNSNRAAFGINLLWLALGLDVVGIVFAWINAPEGAHPNFIVTVLVILLYALLTAKVAGGANWARVIYLLLTLTEVLAQAAISQIPGMATSVATTGLAHTLDVAAPVVRVIGIALLFMKPASEMFRKTA